MQLTFSRLIDLHGTDSVHRIRQKRVDKDAEADDDDGSATEREGIEIFAEATLALRRRLLLLLLHTITPRLRLPDYLPTYGLLYVVPHYDVFQKGRALDEWPESGRGGTTTSRANPLRHWAANDAHPSNNRTITWQRTAHFFILLKKMSQIRLLLGLALG